MIFAGAKRLLNQGSGRLVIYGPFAQRGVALEEVLVYNTSCLRRLILEDRTFAKPGSGQTQGKTQKTTRDLNIAGQREVRRAAEEARARMGPAGGGVVGRARGWGGHVTSGDGADAVG